MSSGGALPHIGGRGLAVLFVGINPGLRSALVRHHFAGPSNRFWKLLLDAGLVPEPVGFADDRRLPRWGYGLTNLVARPTRGIDELRPEEYARGRSRLVRRIVDWRPRLVALVGLTVAVHVRPAGRRERIAPGLQDWTLAGARVFVLPNPSGRNAHYGYEAMLEAFRALRRCLETS